MGFPRMRVKGHLRGGGLNLHSRVKGQLRGGGRLNLHSPPPPKSGPRLHVTSGDTGQLTGCVMGPVLILQVKDEIR